MGEARERAKSGLTRRTGAAPSRWLMLADRLFAIDLRSLATLRIFLAILVLADLWGRSTDLASHYTDSGIYPRVDVLAQDPSNWAPYLSVHMITGTTAGEAVLFALAAIFGIAFLVGYRTTIAAVLTWYMLSSLQWRNFLVNNSADDLLRMLLFWGMFLPLGGRFSLDVWIRKRRDPNAPPEPKRVLSVASAALLLQVGFLYWFAVASKTDPSWRVDGMAIYYTLSIDLYATPVGQFLLNFPYLLQLMTRITIWIEALGPTLAFSPVATPFVRTVIVPMFFAFHLVFLNMCLDLGAFHYVSAVAWIPFLPTELWDRLYRRLMQRRWNTSAAHALRPSTQGGRLAEQEWAALASSGVASETRKGRWSRQSLVLNAIVGLFLIYVFLWNFRAIGRDTVPPPFNRIAQITHVDQGWAMFAPKPFTENGWYVFPGKLKNGKDVNLFLGESSVGKPIRWEKPEGYVSHLFRNERWRRYQMNLWARQYTDQRPYYCRFLCREWNQRHTGGEQLSSFKLSYVLAETLPDYIQPTPQPLILIEWDCGSGGSGGTGKTNNTGGILDASGRANEPKKGKQP